MNIRTNTIVKFILFKITGFNSSNKEIIINNIIKDRKENHKNYLPKNLYDDEYNSTDPSYGVTHCGKCDICDRKHDNPIDCENCIYIPFNNKK